MKRLSIILATSIFFSFFISQISHATIGVGVGTGKIIVEETLKPGFIYQLPSFNVVNTGDEESDYEVTITYHEAQKEIEPPVGWFLFSPQTFHLEPGKSQIVDVKLNLPVKLEPGDYFGYLEAHPVVIRDENIEGGSARINIAAASKLYFTVEPANIFQGIYYKLLTFWKVYHPWPMRASIGIIVVVAILLVKKFFNIEINLKKSKKDLSKNES